MMKCKIYSNGKWEYVNKDQICNDFDSDGYCLCEPCQYQKKLQEENNVKSVVVPESLFEL